MWVALLKKGLAASEGGAHTRDGKLCHRRTRIFWRAGWCAEGDHVELRPLPLWPLIPRLEPFFVSEIEGVLKIRRRPWARSQLHPRHFASCIFEAEEEELWANANDSFGLNRRLFVRQGPRVLYDIGAAHLLPRVGRAARAPSPSSVNTWIHTLFQ